MNCAERVAEHVNGETVVAAGRSSGAAPERRALRCPSNTILAVTDGQALYAFHRDPHDGLIGRWPLGEVGAAKLDARASNLNYLEIVGMRELLLSFADGRSIPTFTDWDPDDMDTWDERVVLVAADPQGSEALCATTLANRVYVSVPGRMVP